MKIETIRRQALALAPQDRAQLAAQLLSSLEELSKQEIEQLWLQQAVQRADEIDRGAVQRIASDVVRQEALALLK